MLNTININLKTDIKTDRPTPLSIKLMSQDKNNNQFTLRFTNGGESVTLDDSYTVEILSKFTKSGTSRLTTAKVRQGYATWKFDTAYITQDEEVRNYVYVRKSGSLVVSADSNAFNFDVGLSEIDKDAGRVAEVYDENYQKHLDEFKENVNFEEIAQAEQARKEAETERELAEGERKANEEARELAEDERENAEAQREVDHANRSAELDGKADKVVINNLVKNGDFSDGSLGWRTHQGGEIEVVDSRLKVNTSTTPYSGTSQAINGKYDLGDIIYTNISVDNPNDYVITLNLQTIHRTALVKISPNFKGAVSVIQSVEVDSPSFVYYITKNGVSDQFSFFVDNVVLLNLTDIFGAGNEPTKEEMDKLINVTGYIGGEYALNNKEMLIWTLALIRRNKNAIVALGGA